MPNNAWGSPSSTVTAVPTVALSATPKFSLNDIMGEQLATKLQSEEEQHAVHVAYPALPSEKANSANDDDCETDPTVDEDLAAAIAASLAHATEPATAGPSTACTASTEDVDLAMAMALQEEEDAHYHRMLNHLSPGKLTVALSKQDFFNAPAPVVDDAHYDEVACAEDDYYFGDGAELEPRISIPRGANSRNAITKHNAHAEQLKHGRLMVDTLPLGVNSGQVRKGERLPARAYHALHERTRRQANARNNRVHGREDRAVAQHVVDARTRLMMYKCVQSGRLSAVHGCVSTGKEAAVFFGEAGDTLTADSAASTPITCDVAVKIFKTTLNEFKSRDQYIADDFRFRKRFSKQNPRRLVKMWAEKEFHNLTRAFNAQIPCPQPIQLRHHILFMSFVRASHEADHRSVPAPKLKDVAPHMKRVRLAQTYEKCVDIIVRLYQDCQLIHGDLSEYNLLYDADERVVVIDMGQSVDLQHPQALAFLYRDCLNITQFFQRCGLSDSVLLSVADLFHRVTNTEMEESELLAATTPNDEDECDEDINESGADEDDSSDESCDDEEDETLLSQQEDALRAQVGDRVAEAAFLLSHAPPASVWRQPDQGPVQKNKPGLSELDETLHF